MGSLKPYILLVDDEEMLRSVAVETLELAGFDVAGACDGVDALEKLEKHPNLYLMVSDVRMPRMNGYELCKMVLARTPNLPIILMTGYADDPPVELRSPPNISFVQKPFDFDLLIEKAAQALATLP